MELARRGYDTFNGRDLDAWLRLVDPDIVLSTSTNEMEGLYHGHDGARAFWSEIFGSFPDLVIEVHEVREFGGDTTLARARLVGHGAGSEAPVELPVWHVSEWRDGKCLRFRSFQTEAEALEAVGLSEQDAPADS